jgi:tryptophan-rich sensory protein
LLALIGFVGLSALVPIARAALATGAVALPLGAPLWPPLWGPAAMLLYPLTGLAAWLVWRRIDVGLERKRAALRLWGWQLLLSGLWPAALYGAHSPALATVLLLLALLSVALTLIAFVRLQAAAALLLLPYCAWLCSAAYLYADRFWLGGI